MKRIYIISSAALAIASILASCSKSDEPPTPQSCKRTVLVYMIATNNLGSQNFDGLDIAEMERAMAAYTDGDCRLLVYRAVYNSSPKLYEIRNNGSSAATEILKEYPTRLRASVTKSRMSEVFNDVIRYAPANDYGLVLWSHSDGWAHTLSSTKATTRDFGEDSGAKMPIDSLADVIPSHMFSFIYTDACHMGGIEVAYQLRDKTTFFIGSPTETPAYGMPYDENIPCFFKDEPDLQQACENTYSSYNRMSGIYKSITISLIDCRKLNDLASVCKDIHSSPKAISSLSEFQYYNQNNPRFFYDFKQYTDSIAPTDALASRFDAALSDVVIYKACTSSIFNALSIDSDKFSGLSTYIMGTSPGTNEEYYLTLDWYKNVIKH